MQTVIAHLAVQGAAAAIEFYKKALGAKETMRMPMPNSDRIMHAEMQIGDSKFFLADEFPEMGHCKSPKSLGSTTVVMHVISPDVDKTVANAEAAGATIVMPVQDMFWGDRYGQFRDPFGHLWAISTPKKQMTQEEMKKGAEEAFGKHG